MQKQQAGFALILLLGAGGALADECAFQVTGGDAIRFDQRTLEVPGSCLQVALTFRHVGHSAARVMGHNWVLAKSKDVSAIANAGAAAGLERNYQPTNDPRIIAATKVVGGGESDTVTFSTAELRPGEDYTYFCSSPGHWSVMKGKLVFRAASKEKLAATTSR